MESYESLQERYKGNDRHHQEEGFGMSRWWQWLRAPISSMSAAPLPGKVEPGHSCTQSGHNQTSSLQHGYNVSCPPNEQKLQLVLCATA